MLRRNDDAHVRVDAGIEHVLTEPHRCSPQSRCCARAAAYSAITVVRATQSWRARLATLRARVRLKQRYQVAVEIVELVEARRSHRGRRKKAGVGSHRPRFARTRAWPSSTSPHRMHEIEELADSCTVLRGGRLIEIFSNGERAPQEILQMMIGRDLSRIYPPKPKPAAGEADRPRGFGLLLDEQALRREYFTIGRSNT